MSHSAKHVAEEARLMREKDPAFARWAEGYGVIRHSPLTQVRVHEMIRRLAAAGVQGDGIPVLEVLEAADRLACAAMWLIVHQTYAARVRLDGAPLATVEFKEEPQGHTGGSLNLAPGYVGYMASNAIAGTTRAWVVGQGHTVSAIDSVNVLLGNLLPEQAARYTLDEGGLTRFVRDFYGYRLNEHGKQEAPLGSHVNPYTAGGTVEGGYLGFTELQYVHMPLPGERLVTFLSDGAFEEQRGSDWAPRWWRCEDSGLVAPIMISNGRRIDQRTTMRMEGGVGWFRRHLALNGFDPIVIDGRDPAAFAWAILEMEARLTERGEQARRGERRYPVPLPYTIAVAPKGAGFHGEGTNAAHNLPLGENPRTDAAAAHHFNEHARRLYVAPEALGHAIDALTRHEASGRPRERDHALATRDARLDVAPRPEMLPLPSPREESWLVRRESPMEAIDREFLAVVRANPRLRARFGNPDESRSNRMNATLDALKHRVTDPEPGAAEDLLGAVITALNEEAVACAALGNKGGLNLVVTYEAFGVKMLGAIRQEIIFADGQNAVGRPPGWLSVPVILTSHTYENGKNERSHQDPTMVEALLGEPSEVSRVLFPVDYNTAAAAMAAAYGTRGQIWTMVVPKGHVPIRFTGEEAMRLIEKGAGRVPWAGVEPSRARVALTAVGAYQLEETLKACVRLTMRDVPATVIALIEPGRFGTPRTPREAAHASPQAFRESLWPSSLEAHVLLTHTRPHVLEGLLDPILPTARTAALGYTNEGGTLDVAGMLFVNGCTWAHAVDRAAALLGIPRSTLLEEAECEALDHRGSPYGAL